LTQHKDTLTKPLVAVTHCDKHIFALQKKGHILFVMGCLFFKKKHVKYLNLINCIYNTTMAIISTLNINLTPFYLT
jgi:hypothetical protein